MKLPDLQIIGKSQIFNSLMRRAVQCNQNALLKGPFSHAHVYQQWDRKLSQYIYVLIVQCLRKMPFRYQHWKSVFHSLGQKIRSNTSNHPYTTPHKIQKPSLYDVARKKRKCEGPSRDCGLSFLSPLIFKI